MRSYEVSNLCDVLQKTLKNVMNHYQGLDIIKILENIKCVFDVMQLKSQRWQDFKTAVV